MIADAEVPPVTTTSRSAELVPSSPEDAALSNSTVSASLSVMVTVAVEAVE